MRAGLDDLTLELEHEGAAMRTGRWGDMHVAHYTLPPGMDLAPFFAALPDGLCAADHYGIVLEGEITIPYGDGAEETTRAGELFHWPAGHTGRTDRGAVFVAISPLAQVEQMERQMAAAAG
jgi:hypothetical protein